MKLSIKKGFSFGLTSAIITTLGLVVGLNSGTHSKMVIIGGILIIAISDSMSDAFGIHISEESENKYSNKEIWESTISTFLSKFLFTLAFIIPIIFLELYLAIIVCILFGLGSIILFSCHMAKKQEVKPYKIIFEHLTIAIVVIFLSNYIGNWVSNFK